MAPVGAANGGDSAMVARGREPVVDRGANAPALDRGIARPGMTGDQQQHPFAVNDGGVQRPVDRLPGAGEVVAVQVDDAVGLHRPGLQLPVPARIERIGDGGTSGLQPE